MIKVYKSYDGLTYENKESCLVHEIFVRSLEVHNAFHNYVSYRGKEHIKICKEYLFIKQQKIKDFEEEHTIFSKTCARKIYWERRTVLKKRLESSIKLLKTLKKEYQRKQKLLKDAEMELEEVRKKLCGTEKK